MSNSKPHKRDPEQEYFPEEIIVEIISRLPPKPLIQFKCVCKKWCNLISDPKFIKKHLNLLQNDDGLRGHKIILRYPYFNIKSCPLDSIYHEPQGYSVELDYPMKESCNMVHIISSCNGLVCLLIEDHLNQEVLYIWNPSTKESTQIQEYGQEEPDELVSHYSFGYCSELDDYMVVKLTVLGIDDPTVKIYSLRNDSWRSVETPFPVHVHFMESSKFVNGKLIWGLHDLMIDQWNLISFDFENDEYSLVPKPNNSDVEEQSFPIVRVLKGCLSVVYDKTGICLDLWMMMELGVKESWVKTASIPYCPELLEVIQVPRTLWFMKYTGILTYFGRTLVLYDVETGDFKFPLIYGVHDCHEADTYVESIVSPMAYKGIGFGGQHDDDDDHSNNN